MSFFFPYYGSKFRLAKEYPAPEHRTIIEPFAGGAGYSARWYDRDVFLLDLDPLIAALWQYLIGVSSAEILRLPLLGPEDHIDDFRICQEAKWLIGFWLMPGDTRPMKKLSSWGIAGLGSSRYWGESARAKIAQRVNLIRHWQAAEATYNEIPNCKATWYIDPPYQNARAGYKYKWSNKTINYPHLGEWCLERKGQVIVCEQEGADWLPFWKLKDIAGCGRRSDGSQSKSTEVISTWVDGKP